VQLEAGDPERGQRWCAGKRHRSRHHGISSTTMQAPAESPK
jgi:hypothetical protein